MKRGRNKVSKIVKKCNHIMLNNFRKCGCVNRKGLPSNNLDKCYKLSKKRKGCKDYALCSKFMRRLMSKSEPPLDLVSWAKKLVSNSHNCYSYFLDDQNIITTNRCRKICRKNGTCKKKIKGCSSLKPQPSYWAVVKGTRKRRNKKYNCKQMLKSIKDDNRHIKLTKFDSKCPKNYYKGVVVVDTKNPTYHFLRQDNNMFWSHKPGTTPVSNTDASKRLILVPHLSDMNYAKNNGSLNYDKTCSYMCVPNNSHMTTYSI